MKNKKSIYILLPLVLFIWGTILYQFLPLSYGPDLPKTNSSTFRISDLDVKKRDTFTIDVNYRDPFLGKVYNTTDKSSQKINVTKKIVAKTVLPYPLLQYKGIVSDSRERDKIFMLIIDGKSFLMKSGESKNGVTLVDGNRLSVTLRILGKLETIPLQK